MKKITILTFLLITIQHFCFSQTNYSFTTFNHDNGLIDNYVESIYEDSRGFIWIGTRGGLNRFDGHSFMKIELPRMKSSSSYEIGQHYITTIIEDLNNNIWIGTLAGIYVYSIKDDTFKMYENDPKNPKSLSNNLIETICIDKANTVWIGTRHGLNKFNRKNENFTSYFCNPKNPKSINDNYIFALSIDKNNSLWIGTLSGGINKYNSKDNSFTHYSTQIPQTEIRAIFEDSKKTIWIASSHEGIFVKKNNDTNFTKILQKEMLLYPKFFSALSGINEDNDGNIWISSYMDGIGIYNIKNKTLQIFKEDMASPKNLCGNSIKGVNRDKYGNMWIYSHGGGFSFYSPIGSSIISFSKSPFPNSIPGNLISCFNEDNEGNIWIGTDGSGFSIFSPKIQKFNNISFKNGLNSDAVLAIAMLNKENVAIATWNGGLSIYNTKTKIFKNYLFETNNKSNPLQSIYGLYFDSRTQLLWCNTYGNGVQIFNVKTNSFISKDVLTRSFPFWNSSMFSSKIVFDKIDYSIWFIDGLRLGKALHKKSYYYTDSDSTINCSDAYFCNDIIQNKKGDIYIATYSGFKKYNRDTDCFNNLVFNSIDLKDAKALLEDKYGNIWITTSKGLFKYSPKGNKIIDMSKIWGMPQLQYYRKSAFRTTDGHLYFGSLKGFMILHEDSTYTYKITPRLFLTKLFINNIEQHPNTDKSPLHKDISLLKKLTVKHDQSFISIEFAVLNYIDNQKSKCRYKLDGFDKDWIYVDNQRRASYTNIPPGKYTFLLSTTNSEGEWIKKPLKFKITVLPPWWQTIWFQIGIALAIIFSIIGYIINRERNIRDTNKDLEKKVDLKTSELQNANSRLQEQKNTIEQHYENLQEQQLVIEIKNSQLQEALNTKDKLLTVIAHDFKNPLSTLLMYANVVRDKILSNKSKDIITEINSIVNSAENIYSQMIEVLEWSVSKNDDVKYNPIDINVEIVIKDVLSLINETANQKNILIETFSNFYSNAYVDPRMMSTIMRNLIINSIKFTPKHGKISISIIEQKTCIDIILKDTGIGMNQDQINRILSDKTVISEDLRSGFGLQICKTFINRNNGTFSISSELEKGSTFTVSLPKGGKLEKPVEKIKEVVYNTFSEFEEEDNQRKMLVIDDNIEITNYLKDLFSESFNVIVAHDGKEGLDKALHSLPEIILSDINMPILDGKKLIQQLKSNSLTNHIPIIIISAQTSPFEQIDGLQHGADDFISKPFNANILKQKVHILLKNRELLIEHLKSSINNIDKFNLPDSFDDKIIKDITAVIIENINNVDFKVEMLAQRVGLSRSQLYRKTISVLGQSPNDYIKSLRLQQAIEMLKTGRYRISEIAYEVGFSDPGYFSSCFLEKYGIKPSDYGKDKV